MSTKTTADTTATTATIGARRGFPQALAAGGKAYVTGVTELAHTLTGFGREVLGETGAHVRASLNANNLRALGELQVGFAQHRVETAATHAKEFADLARARSEDVIAPLTALLKPGATA